ncbi:MAG: OmpA family protein [Sandaracinaceae bacterium]|nr:OmpA family protein [Sandaracinaceae bacterium]
MKRTTPLLAITITLSLAACGGGQSTSSSGGGASSGAESASGGSASSDSAGGSSSSGGGSSAGEFQLSESQTADQAHGDHPSAITSTATHAAMRLFVVDPDSGPTTGVVIKLTGPDGHAYYTHETDSQGYAEVLVPAGARYDLEYLSLGRRSTTAHVDVPAGPRQDIRLTLRYRRWHPPPRPVIVPREPEPTPATPEAPPPAPEPEGLVLEGILFQSGSATIDPESNPRLDRVVEYMTHMTSVRIRISGHTDNVGNPQRNRTLSQERADAVRAYLVAHGVDGARVEAIGYGDTRPVAPNDTEEGRQQNRRIEAAEL